MFFDTLCDQKAGEEPFETENATRDFCDWLNKDLLDLVHHSLASCSLSILLGGCGEEF